MMFTPKKWKFKKLQKGKKLNTVTKVYSFNASLFNKIGLIAKDSGHMTSKQVASFRQTINKIIKKTGNLKINIFPQVQVTKKPLEVRMGKGKGNVDRWIAKIRSGTLLCEIQTPNTSLRYKSLKLAQIKIPLKTRIVTRL